MRKHVFQPHTLHRKGIDSLAIWQSGFSLLWIIFAWILIAEIVARTPLGYLLPPPSVGADSFEFDIKVYYLEQSIRQRGELDCLIVGDSMTNDGPDPVLVEKAYQAAIGSPLHCFNFGMPALMLDASGPLTTALNQRFHPKLLIFILSPRNFTPAFGAPFHHVAFSEWSQQNLGDTSLRGWAVNSVYGYRYALFFEYWLIPSNRKSFSNAWHDITHQGFTPLYGHGESPEISGSGETFQATDPAAIAGFEQILKLRQSGVNLLIIDAPIRPDYYEAYRKKFFRPYIETMQSTFDPLAIPFWLTQDLSERIPPEGWYDLQHVNIEGTQTMSTWLGEKLAENYPAEFFK